jgi:ribosomal protein S18 acetylase RimI-like enzyme
MVPASRSDKHLVVQILTEAFQGEPQIEWIVAPVDKDRERRLQVLMEYAFETGLSQGQVYLTDDRKGVAIWKTPPKRSFSVHDLLTQLKFILAMGLPRLKRLIQMEKYVEQQHPSQRQYLYLWFLAVKPGHQGKGLASELLNPLLEEASQKDLPVLLETSVKKNISLYRHKGFEVFHQWHLDQENQILLQFMRKT